MTPNSGNDPSQDTNRYLEAWADQMLFIWMEKIYKYDINLSYSLVQSLVLESLEKDTTGTIRRIEFSFLEYGLYVDRGTGREIPRGNSGDIGFTPKRQPRPWYSKKLYASLMNLLQDLPTITGEETITMFRRVIQSK